MNNRNNNNNTDFTKYILLLLTLVCSGMIVLSFLNPSFSASMKSGVSWVIIPVQNGMNDVGLWFSDKADSLKEISDVMAENKQLKEQIAQLREDNTHLLQQHAELQRLREQYKFEDDFAKYEKIGAKIIGKDPGNWFHVFTINKGTDDGVDVDMNVISGGGLVGIVIEAGEKYARVRSIIDDDSSVSAEFQRTTSRCIVEGSLKQFNEGILPVIEIDKEAQVEDGNKLVTSSISTKFLPDILIGYVKEIKDDSNNLTKSGYVIPIVDFAHLKEVLVITQLKSTPSKNKK